MDERGPNPIAKASAFAGAPSAAVRVRLRACIDEAVKGKKADSDGEAEVRLHGTQVLPGLLKDAAAKTPVKRVDINATYACEGAELTAANWRSQ